MSGRPRVVAILPTRNESGSISWVIDRLAEAGITLLVIDDDSPDGTAEVARRRIAEIGADGEVIVRAGKRGRGTAVIDGMRLALKRHREVDFFFELDADGSHDPSELNRMLGAATSSGADLVIGARVPRQTAEGSLWPLHRRLFHRANRWLIARVLHLPTSDPTNGMRLWRRGAAALVSATPLRESGFIWVAESTDALNRAGGQITEVETSFYPRIAGSSKAGPAELFDALRGLMRISRRPAPVSSLDRRPPTQA